MPLTPSAALPDGETPLLAEVDALAADLERAARPVTFEVARTDDDVEAVLRLRYRTVVENEWASADALPAGLERDEYDDDAVHVVGRQSPADSESRVSAGRPDLVACARLVFPAPARPLPTEAVFGVTVGPAGRVVDVGRGLVVSHLRGDGHRVLLGLLARCWLELRARGFSTMCGDAPRWLLDVYRHVGFVVEELGPPRQHWGEDRIPVRIDGKRSAPGLLASFTRGGLTDRVR